MSDQIISPRIAVVGHYTYFSNHFPELWRNDKNILCLDVDERDYSFLLAAYNFRPDVTVFYRPELYPSYLVDMIGGLRIAFLSEPVPELRDGHQLESAESLLRLAVYQKMSWSSYDRIYYYDKSKASMIEKLGWRVTGYKPLPIDTSSFRSLRSVRPIDICFVGKATPYRTAQLEFLRALNLRFVWIAHGVSGSALASLFRRSKVVLNVHADGLPALEPRLWLAAACGCVVLTEKIPEAGDELSSSLVQFDGSLTLDHVEEAMNRFDVVQSFKPLSLDGLSFRSFIKSELASDRRFESVAGDRLSPA